MIKTYDFEVVCKNAIIEHNKEEYNETFTIEDISVVWFCKTLGNIKGLFIDNGANQRYYEVTLNGANEHVYLDCYEKKSNKHITSMDKYKGVK